MIESNIGKADSINIFLIRLIVPDFSALFFSLIPNKNHKEDKPIATKYFLDEKTGSLKGRCTIEVLFEIASASESFLLIFPGAVKEMIEDIPNDITATTNPFKKVLFFNERRVILFFIKR